MPSKPLYRSIDPFVRPSIVALADRTLLNNVNVIDFLCLLVFKMNLLFRAVEVKWTNFSTQSAQIFSYGSVGRHILWKTLTAMHTTLTKTFKNQPWTCLDEEGEKMLMSCCWWEHEEGEEVFKEECSTVFFAPPKSVHDNIQIDLRINAPSLKALTIRLLKRRRQRNGLEWPRDRIPASFIQELDRVEDRHRSFQIPISLFGNRLRHERFFSSNASSR